MSERAPYSRVYWSIVDDPKFSHVYDDDRALATWLRLLLLADQAYPASATLPRGVNEKALRILVGAELVDLGSGHRFRIHGLDSERARRRPAVAGPAPGPVLNRATTGPEQDHDRNGVRGLSRAEPSRGKDEPSTGTTRAPDPADVLWTLTGRYPTDKALGWVDDLTSSYGPEPVIRALATAHAQDRNGSTLLGRTQDVLRAEARALSLKEQSAVKATLKERRATPREDIDPEALAAEVRRIMEAAA